MLRFSLSCDCDDAQLLNLLPAHTSTTTTRLIVLGYVLLEMNCLRQIDVAIGYVWAPAKRLADPVGRKPAMVGMSKWEVGGTGSPRFVCTASKA
jgi:hypothetical protein